jgi:hypothetical protein
MIYEAKKKKGKDDDDTRTTTTTTTKTKTPTADIFGKKDSPVSKTEPTDKSKDKPADEPIELDKASQADTLRAASGLAAPDYMRNLVDRMDDIAAELGDDDDDQVQPAPTVATTTTVDATPKLPKPPSTELVTMQTLPDVIEKALATGSKVRPTWHKVSNLPRPLMGGGYRKIAKKLFEPVSSTSIDDMYMIGNALGQGIPNSDREVRAVIGYLKKNGEWLEPNDNPGQVELGDVWRVPGKGDYQYMFRQVKANGIRWFVAKDGFGILDRPFDSDEGVTGWYVYVWPEQDSTTYNDKNLLPKEKK